MNNDQFDELTQQLPIFLLEDNEFIKKFLENFISPVTEGQLCSDDTCSTGVKFDDGKLPIALIPPELIIGVGNILNFGAKKYSERNWEKGMKYSRVYSALQRHLIKWWDPYQSDTDEETGESHLAHAACCLAFLLSYEARGEYGEFDDRPNRRDGTRKE